MLYIHRFQVARTTEVADMVSGGAGKLNGTWSQLERENVSPRGVQPRGVPIRLKHCDAPSRRVALFPPPPCNVQHVPLTRLYALVCHS